MFTPDSSWYINISQGWEEEKASVKDTTKKANESEVVYGDSVPGFVRSKHGPEVHDVSAPPAGEDLQVLEHAVEKLEADNTGIEGDEVSALIEAELVALQVRDRNANCIFLRGDGLAC